MHSRKRWAFATAVVDHRPHGEDRAAFERALQGVLDEHRVEVVCLARLHAPAYAGLRAALARPHAQYPPVPSCLRSRASIRTGKRLRAGVKISGATVHFVIPETDAGPIIAQAAVPVRDDDMPETLAARVLAAEHRLYPLALALLAAGRLRIVGARCLIEGEQQTPSEVLVVPDR